MTPDWLYRIPFYIIYGLVCEVLFTAICDLISPKFIKSWNVFGKESSARSPSWRFDGRDPRAVGYSFLWMIPIYGLLVFMEPVSRGLSPLPWPVRGMIYVLVLWIMEYLTGFLIKKISGFCPWDYSASRFNLHGYVRFDFFPFWFAFMMMAEGLSRKLILLTPALKEVFFNYTSQGS